MIFRWLPLPSLGVMNIWLNKLIFSLSFIGRQIPLYMECLQTEDKKKDHKGKNLIFEYLCSLQGLGQTLNCTRAYLNQQMYFFISFYLTDPSLKTPTVPELGGIHRGAQHQHNHIIKLCIIYQFAKTQKGLTLQALPSQQTQQSLLLSTDSVSHGQC